MAEIVRAKPMNEYDNHEDFSADISRMRTELMEATGLSEGELHEAGPQGVEQRLAELGHVIVDAE